MIKLKIYSVLSIPIYLLGVLTGLCFRAFYPGLIKGVYWPDNIVKKINEDNYEAVCDERKAEYTD